MAAALPYVPAALVLTSMSKTRIAVLGATGRMGRAVIHAVAESTLPVVLGAAFERSGHAELGTDAAMSAGLPAAGVRIRDDIAAGAGDFDVLVDFTRPQGTLAALAHCVDAGRGMIIGTTGFSDSEKARIGAAAQRIPICMAANFSVGVNLCLKLLEEAARVFAADSDIEIVEAHHRHKVDAPSGTALAMGEAVARGAGIDLAQHTAQGRDRLRDGARRRCRRRSHGDVSR
jgi:4-hydroxy-tetrahydrodipicolinate reductase